MPVLLAALLDLGSVLTFVAIGRGTHEGGHGALETLATAWPFALALALGWAVARAWRAPTALVPTGFIVWGAAGGGGMALRVLAGGTTQWSFILVTALFLAATLLGWRVLAHLTRRTGAVKSLSAPPVRE